VLIYCNADDFSDEPDFNIRNKTVLGIHLKSLSAV